MDALRQHQSDLLAAIVAQATDDAVCARMFGIDEADSQRRIAVYQRNITGACVNALRQTYPVCAAVVGNRCFAALAAEYVAGHPSTDPDLNRYGEWFDRTLAAATCRPGFEGMDYLAQLTRLEWCWQATYYAPDDAPFNHREFQRALQRTPARLVLSLSASVCMVHAMTPVYAIWSAHRRGNLPDMFPPAEEHIVIWRKDHRRFAKVIDSPTFALLRAIQTGRPLGKLVEQGSGLEALPALLSMGWLAGFSVLA